MRKALVFVFVLISLSVSAQQKFSTAPLPPTTTLKKISTVGLQQRLITQEEINRLDSINKLFPNATLPLYSLDYLKAGYVQYYTPDYEEYGLEQGRIYFKIPYEHTQNYGAQKLVSKYEYTFCYDTLKQAWLRQIGNWPYFRRDSIFLHIKPTMYAHSPASYNVDTLRVYEGANKVFDTKGKTGGWYLPHYRFADKNIVVYTLPENASFVAKVKIKKKAKKYTPAGDDTLGIAKLRKYTAEIDTNYVISSKMENLHLVKDIYVVLDSSCTGSVKKGGEYYMVMTGGEPFRTEPMHLVYYVLPYEKPVAYVKPLKYIKLKATTGRKGEGAAEPKE